LFISVSFGENQTPGHEAMSEVEDLEKVERQRLRALVAGDLSLAKQLHADEFQLVNPFGVTLSKEQYLGGIESGQIKYLVWEPVEEIAVRTYGSFAAVRYRANLEILVQGQRIPMRQYWHTDTYEKKDGQWQVVWSQATEIKQ
jgi:hypothetical protein